MASMRACHTARQGAFHGRFLAPCRGAASATWIATRQEPRPVDDYRAGKSRRDVGATRSTADPRVRPPNVAGDNSVSAVVFAGLTVHPRDHRRYVGANAF